MKVALLTWESLHSIRVGGVAVHVSELASALARKGHEVHVFTRMGARQQPYEHIHGVHYHHCGVRLDPDFIEEIHGMCRSLVHYLFQTEDHIGPFDVVHAHDWLTASAMIWIKQGRGRKTVFTFHSTEYGRSGNRFLEGRGQRVREQERAATYWADRVITVSHSLKREIMWMYETPEWKISTIYNGVNVHDYDGFINPAEIKARYGIGPTDPTVLFTGRIVHQKGPDVLVEAIPAILRHHPSAKFVFAGDGDMRTSLEIQSHHLRVAHATRFLGFKNGNELTNLYKACDVVCMPSRNEPFGIVVLEAWSAGKPVVVTRNGGPDEFVWHEVNGLKIYPTPDLVAWGVGAVFSNFDWARWMGRNGRIAAETVFSWDAVANHVAQVYTQ
jgi:glycogen synthase